MQQKIDAYLKPLAVKISGEFSLNPAVVVSVCEIESGWDTFAVRYEPQWRYLLNPAYWSKRVETSAATETVLQSCSWGLMQVMGSVARELGFTGDFPQLCTPELGIRFGCAKLVDCLKRYPKLPDALAAYNAGNPKSPAGKEYALKVMGKMSTAL